jgi:hypothetical protein
MRTLYEFLLNVAEKSSKEYLKGSLKMFSHNGPYNDCETNVRTTAHWLYLFSNFSHSDKPKIVAAANKALDYLLSKNARPMDASFFCRKNPEKDFSNGLMGQAWVLESLLFAAHKLNRNDAFQLAKEVYFLHPWDENRGIWRILSVDGSYLSIDNTFNHQLWFASIGTLLEDNESIRRGLVFLEKNARKVQTYNDGIIYHKSRLSYDANRLNISKIFNFINQEINGLKNWNNLYLKSVGYHSFNLYALAILKQKFPKHSFWSTAKFTKILNVTKSASFDKMLELSNYSWPYNPPGLELAFAGEVFNLGHEYCQDWINKQFVKTYDGITNDLLTKNSADRIVSKSRIYEAVRLTGNYTIPCQTI